MTSPEWLAADEDDSDRFPQASDVSTTFTFKHSCGATVHVVDAKEQPHECSNVPSPDPARVARWEFLVQNTADWWPRQKAEAAMALADEERAALVAEVERLRGERDLMARHVREARELTEAAEAKVAKVEALHRPSGDIAGSTAAKLAERFGSACMHCAVPWPCPTIAVLADAPAEQTIKQALWHEAERTVSMVCPECSAEGSFVDHEPLVETVSALVHSAWMDAKREQGVMSRPSEWGEEQMVPYADLSERAKDLDRGTVRAVLDALRAVLADAPAERPDLDRPCACGHLLTDHLDGLACYAGTTVTSEFACDCREWRPGAPAEQRAEGGA